MQQRFNTTTYSDYSTTRQPIYIQLPSIQHSQSNDQTTPGSRTRPKLSPMPFSTHSTHSHQNQRATSQQIFERQEHELEKSLSQESGKLTKNLHLMRRANTNSKGSLADANLMKSVKEVMVINQVVKDGYEGKGGDRVGSGENIRLRKFEFVIYKYALEVVIAYGITIGLMYLIKATNFPFFLLLFVFTLTLSIRPWHSPNILTLTPIPIIIANHFLSTQILSYPSILICYFSCLLFTEHNKRKMLFIPILVVTLVWGFVVIPEVYLAFAGKGDVLTFYYVFPVFVFLVRIGIYGGYRLVGDSEGVFLQLPLFVMGLEYGVIMNNQVGSVQFWYLMVFFTLGIINQRTQFMLGILTSLFKACSQLNRKKKKQKRDNSNKGQKYKSINQLNPSLPLNPPQTEPLHRPTSKKSLSPPQPTKRDLRILPAHASGHSSITTPHIICLVYLFTKLPLYSSPYTKDTTLSIYIQNEVYIPLVIWALGLVYELMCLVLERKRRDKLLIGWTEGERCWGWGVVARGALLAVGLWMFYLGLGIGSYLKVYGG